MGSGYRMKVITHILVVALLVAFGTAGVVNISAATSMEMQMLMTADDHSEVAGCEDCGSDGVSMMSCADMCVTFHAVTLVKTESDEPEADRLVFSDVPVFLIGRMASPDPFPPKAIILN